MKINEMVEFLFYVAEYGAFNEEIEIKTTEFSEKYETSQQTASRKLIELEKKGYIERKKTQKGSFIILTDSGRKLLEDLNIRLEKVIKSVPESMEIIGNLETGMGEGKYYVTLSGYESQFKKKLNFNNIHPGTLNLRLSEKRYIDRRRILNSNKFPGILIEGWSDTDRTYGEVLCYKAKLNGSIDGAVLNIKRTSHPDEILEIISPDHLREKMNLNDGDEVKVTIYFNKD